MPVPSVLPVRRQLRLALLPLLLLPSLTACGASIKPVLVHRQPPPPDLTTCPDQPARPAVWLDDNDMLGWSFRAIVAGAECRSTLKKLAEWAKEPL